MNHSFSEKELVINGVSYHDIRCQYDLADESFDPLFPPSFDYYNYFINAKNEVIGVNLDFDYPDADFISLFKGLYNVTCYPLHRNNSADIFFFNEAEGDIDIDECNMLYEEANWIYVSESGDVLITLVAPLTRILKHGVNNVDAVFDNMLTTLKASS